MISEEHEEKLRRHLYRELEIDREIGAAISESRPKKIDPDDTDEEDVVEHEPDKHEKESDVD